jgi:hypothetical protein
MRAAVAGVGMARQGVSLLGFRASGAPAQGKEGGSAGPGARCIGEVTAIGDRT